MSFKEGIKKFIGIKTEEELNKVKTPKEKIIEFIKSLLFAGIVAFFIITFIVQNTRIPTGSMEGTIEIGDFVLVNKFIYGSETPKYIPLTQIEIPHFRFPALRKPRRKDIVVFEFPGARDRIKALKQNVSYVKRCIGLPGDTIQVIDKVVYVNHKQFWIPPHIQYLDPVTNPKGEVDPQMFPKGMTWNRDNYGPIVVPKKGDKLHLNASNISQWETTIDREFGRKVVSVNNGQIFIEGKPVSSYIFKRDYYFMMGDNRDESWDSRYWGFVPDDNIEAEAFITLFSWNRDIPFTDFFNLIGSIRPERILLLLH